MPKLSDCKIVHIGENGDEDTLDEMGLDLEAVTKAAEKVFKSEHINISREEEVVLAAICGKKVVGAATVGHHNEEGEPLFTFSAAVAEGWQRLGLGRKLVLAAIQEARAQGAHSFRVWVVNPNMAVLLESLGFETEGREWSEDSPHMYFSV